MNVAWLSKLKPLFRFVPFPAMTAVVVWLYLIEEQFPFSNFPMYSNVSDEADVVFVTDQDNRPLPMRAIFKTSSSSTKKIYNRKVIATANANQRDSEHATDSDRHHAALKVLDFLDDRIIHQAVPPGTKALRLQMITLEAGEPTSEEVPIFLAEVPYHNSSQKSR